MIMILKYKKALAFKMRYETVPILRVILRSLMNPLFVRPFKISEEDKPFKDRQMERLVTLGIMTYRRTSHMSPVMLITCKLTKDQRPVVDFQLLNTRIIPINTSIPLISDVLSILGNSKCKVLSCPDLKDAYHIIHLTETSKEYCCILPYFGSPIHRYKVLPMGIACVPQIWMDYVILIMNDLDQRL